MASRKSDVFLKPAADLFGAQELMHQDVTEMTPENLVSAYLVLDALLKDKGALALRKEAIGEQLKRIVEKLGKVEDPKKGHQVLDIRGVKVIREKRVATKPEESGLRSLVEQTKGVTMKDVTQTVATVTIDTSKIKALVSLGKLSEASIDALRKVTWALKVSPGEKAKSILESAGLGSKKKK